MLLRESVFGNDRTCRPALSALTRGPLTLQVTRKVARRYRRALDAPQFNS
jgi:hypothetical protein